MRNHHAQHLVRYLAGVRTALSAFGPRSWSQYHDLSGQVTDHVIHTRSGLRNLYWVIGGCSVVVYPEAFLASAVRSQYPRFQVAGFLAALAALQGEILR